METQYTRLSMTPSGVPPVIYMSQNDIGRPIGFICDADLSDYSVVLEATRTDGTPITVAVTVDGNICAFETTATMTNKADVYIAQIVVTNASGKHISSIPIKCVVVLAAMNENSEGIEEDAPLYQQYTGTVQSLIADIRTQLNAEAAARQAADNTLQSNINSEASTRATVDASLQSQINQLIAPSGEAPSAAEVENARVGADGTVYATLGDAIRTQDTQLKSAITQLDNGKAALYPDTGAWYRGYFVADGSFRSNTTNAAPTNVPFVLKSEDTLYISPNGLVVLVSQYTKNGNTYTHKSTNTYAEDTNIKYDSDTYISIHVKKPSGATLTLAEVTTKLWVKSEVQKQIDSLGNDIDALDDKIDAVDADFSGQINDVNSFIFTDGDAVTLQQNTAETFSINVPERYLHVFSTAQKIYTGSINFIDLFGLKQGTFTDPASGVVVEITGNEIYLHGSPSTGFKFDFQKGEFFTDSFANHPADLSFLPSDFALYQMCEMEKSGYTMPSNVYLATLKPDGSGLQAVPLTSHAKDIGYPVTGQYFAMYSNGAISNLNVKFTIGLKIKNLPGTIAGIEAIPNIPYDTKAITKPGYYTLGTFTWTGASNVYSAKSTDINFEPDPLTNGHVYAWFGDSLSQLKELPNLVADLLNVKVYDCTFAGAPLTYGDPTKYQPTGFMSLCSQIVAGDFTPLSDALDAQEAAGTNVTEKRQHLATLEALDFSTVTDIVLLAGTNDFDNDYVNATNFVSGFSGALTTLLTAYPHLMVYVISPPWRGDKTEGVTTIPTMEDIVELEKGVADDFCLPWYDLYHRSGINSLTASVYLTNDLLHPSDAGDALLANKCAKFIQSN